jgi:hypothetical protein
MMRKGKQRKDMPMNLATVKSAIAAAPKGANIILEWVRPAKVKKAAQGDNIEKHVRMVGRMGIEYDAMKSTVERRESGEAPAENAGLPWGEWLEYPYLIQHKGKVYLRLYVGTSRKVTPKVEWTRNGQPVSREDIESALLASEKSERKGDTFTCTLANLTRVHIEDTSDNGIDSIQTPAADPVTA